MGSDSDLPVMQEAARILEDFGVEYDVTVCSAHRLPEETAAYARGASARVESRFSERAMMSALDTLYRRELAAAGLKEPLGRVEQSPGNPTAGEGMVPR